MDGKKPLLNIVGLTLSWLFTWVIVAAIAGFLSIYMLEDFHFFDVEITRSQVLIRVLLDLIIPTLVGIGAFTCIKKNFPTVRTYWLQVGLTSAFYLGGIIGLYMLNLLLELVGIDLFIFDQPIFFDAISLVFFIPFLLLQSILFPFTYSLFQRK